MRQIGSLTRERDAQRFAAYLVTLGIEAHTEQDAQEWAIWVRDENRLDEARKAFETFRYDPEHQRYQGAEREAESIRRAAVNARLSAQKNVIEMRGKWKSPGARRAPLTATLIALSILVTLLGGFGKAKEGFGRTVNEQLQFVSFADQVAWAKAHPTVPTPNPLASIMKGELWRTITPIFIHLDFIHLLFNMIMFYQFGQLLESLRGTTWFAVAALLIAIISNVAQGVMPESFGGNPYFGGMSGVVYGLFGYAWMKSLFDPQPGFFLSPVTVAILLGWLVLCIVGMDNVANVAHVVGLVVGATIGILPRLWSS